MEKKGNFTRLPNNLFDGLAKNDMDIKDVIVYFGITRNKDGFQLSLRRLNKITGIPILTVKESIERLVKHKYISVKTETVKDVIPVSSGQIEVVNEYKYFTNLVDFSSGEYREFPNFWLFLATGRTDFDLIYPGMDGMYISPSDVAVLMYLSRRKFQNDKVVGKDLYRVNFTADSAIVGLTRSTFAKSFKKLIDLRFIAHSPSSGKIAIRHGSVKEFFLLKKKYVLSKHATEETVLQKFSIIDRVNLMAKIERATNRGSVQAIKDYVMKLMQAEKITEAEAAVFFSLADGRITFLHDHYEETSDATTLTAEDFYPLTLKNEISMERALGHYI